MPMLLLVLTVLLSAEYLKQVETQSTRGVELGFPTGWDGDKFRQELCPSQNIPTWLDGYFMVQTSAAYGKRTDPVGKKLTHMFDGLGAVASIEMTNGQVKFSATYYPSRPYKIWNFYDRDMSKSNVAWDPIRSSYNATSLNMWKNIKDDEIFPMHPNIDFWQIGHTVVAATEFVGVGMQFNVSTLDEFKSFLFRETDNIFKGTSTIIPLTMPVHERMENDGTIYAACAAFDPSKNKMYQIVFKITPDGVRTTEGLYDHGTYEPDKCTPDGRYLGEKKILAGYMHSITSTKQYLILPVTSYILNPCKLPPISDKAKPTISKLLFDIKENPVATEFATDVPLRFLVFDKRNKRFVTIKPMDVYPASFITHQFNAYEDDDGTLVADMIGSEGMEGFYEFLTPDNIITRGFNQSNVRLSRYRINLRTSTIQRTHILSDQEKISGEFSNYNRNFMERKYKYGYMVVNPFMAGNKIIKIDVDGRRIVADFSAPGSRAPISVLREPWFVQRPGSTEEDDGVLLVLSGDVVSKTTVLYVLDAKTLRIAGQAEIPTFIPFGFHNRFYSKEELGKNPSIKNVKDRTDLKTVDDEIEHAFQPKTDGTVTPGLTAKSTSRLVTAPEPVLWNQLNILTPSSKELFNNFMSQSSRDPASTMNKPMKTPPTQISSISPVDLNQNPKNSFIYPPSTVSTIMQYQQVKRGNLIEDDFGLPTTSLSSVNWSNLVEQGKKLICTLFKDAIDNAGSRFCQKNATEQLKTKVQK